MWDWYWKRFRKSKGRSNQDRVVIWWRGIEVGGKFSNLWCSSELDWARLHCSSQLNWRRPDESPCKVSSLVITTWDWKESLLQLTFPRWFKLVYWRCWSWILLPRSSNRRLPLKFGETRTYYSRLTTASGLPWINNGCQAANIPQSQWKQNPHAVIFVFRSSRSKHYKTYE